MEAVPGFSAVDAHTGDSAYAGQQLDDELGPRGRAPSLKRRRRNCLANPGRPGWQSGVTMVAAVDGRVDSSLVERVVAVDAGVGGRAGVGQRLKDELVPGRGRIPKRWRGSGAVNHFPMKAALDDDEQGPRDRAPSPKR